VTKLEDLVPVIMSGRTKEYLNDLMKEFHETGLPEEIARRVATYRAMYTALNIIDVASHHRFDLIKTAKVYFAAGERVHLLWFRDQIARDSRDGHWNVLARLTLRDQLDASQKGLTVSVMKDSKNESDVTKLIDKWVGNNQRALERWENLLSLLRSSTSIDYTMFFIAMRELDGLILNG
jgi:glutamate dehydrogenase